MATLLFVKTAETSQPLLLPVNLQLKLKHLLTVIRNKFPVSAHKLVLYISFHSLKMTDVELVVSDVMCHEGHAGGENYAICPGCLLHRSAFSKRSFSPFLPENDFFSALLQEHVLAIVSCSLSIPRKLNHESFIDTPGDAGRT